MRPRINGYMNGYLEKAMASMSGPFLDPSAQTSAMQDTSWADGVRGIAALFVVASHIVLCFARRIVLPCCGAVEGVPHLFQRPIFRLIAQGHSWVAMFLILLGFVNALKPVKLARSGQVESALSNLALASFRRTFRLMLPAAAATVVSWVVCQLGMYEMARNGDAYWLYTYTPMMSFSWGTALDDLFHALRATWTIWEINPYDQPQWALIYLLQGSMFVFCALLVTVNLTPAWRTTLLAIFALWSSDWSMKYHDPLVGFTIFSGIILAELSLTTFPERVARFSPFLTPPLALLGLVLMSQPSDHPQSAPWSNYLETLGQKIFPPQGDLARTWGSVGSMILIIAIMISPHARRLLSRKPLIWLGKVSFPIYLLHGTFMRSLLAWFTFAGQTPQPFEIPTPEGESYSVHRYPQPGSFRILLSIAVSMGCMLAAAHYWTKNVEPVFGHITKSAEDIMFGKGDGGSSGNSGRPMLPVKKDQASD